MMTVKKRSKKAILSKKYCVIAYDVNAKFFPNCGTEFHRTLNVGTLVGVDSISEDPYVVVKVVNLEGQYNGSDEDLWLCHKDALIPIDKGLWPLLCAVPSPVERVYLLREKGLLEELATIEVGSLVCVIGENEHQTSTAVVKFKGPIITKGPGIYFGVEILDGDCEGENDGCFRNQRLFTCPQGTGLILSVNRLRLARSQFLSSSPPKTSVQSLKDKFERMHRSYASDVSHLTKSSSKCECEKSNLKVGDRVVWISDDGPADGVVVRRLGCHDNDLLRVSVQFDEPVKGGVACSSESARTSVLPAVELVKASDFYGSQGKENGHVLQWSNGVLEKNKEVGARLSKSSQDLISLHTPPPSNSEDAISTGSEGSGYYDTPESTGDESLGVGSLVEVAVKGEPLYGVIRWVGSVPGDKRPRKIAGIEMEEEHPGFGDGMFNGIRYFCCNPQRAFFVNLNQCKKDSRFQDIPNNAPAAAKPEDFGCIESPSIQGFVRPREGDISSLCGKYRGIQGHHNSCYLDATLFSMFTFTSVFDSLLYRPAGPSDIPHYEEVQRVLREDIVNPLRENLYVRADRVMKLRTLMEKLSSVSGLTTEEKDPEEFLTSLVAQLLKAEPFLKLNSGQEAYHYQLFVEKDEALSFPTVQQLFEQSILTSDIKLKEVPSCLIIQMPRFGKSYKMYPRILPSQLLDVTDVIENSPRQCTVCGKLAEYECKQCFDQCDVGLQSISFCTRCLETVHNHERRRSHSWRRLSVPHEFTALKDHCLIPRLYMQLFAVVCIETSHYVTFVKCGTGSEAPWCFFDSMADRKGEQNGYNIPEVVSCPNLPYWLSEKGSQTLSQIKDERQLPEHAKRLLCDAYMCMYQSTEVMMYR